MTPTPKKVITPKKTSTFKEVMHKTPTSKRAATPKRSVLSKTVSPRKVANRKVTPGSVQRRSMVLLSKKALSPKSPTRRRKSESSVVLKGQKITPRIANKLPETPAHPSGTRTLEIPAGSSASKRFSVAKGSVPKPTKRDPSTPAASASKKRKGMCLLALVVVFL